MANKKKAFLIEPLPSWCSSSFTTYLGRNYITYKANDGWIYHVGTTKRIYQPGSIVVAEYRTFPANKKYQGCRDSWEYWLIIGS